MKIIFASAHDVDADSWIKPLQALVPQADIQQWLDDGSSIGAELAVVWNPPRDIFLRETGLQAVFNLGAGVDALFRLEGLKATCRLCGWKMLARRYKWPSMQPMRYYGRRVNLTVTTIIILKIWAQALLTSPPKCARSGNKSAAPAPSQVMVAH